MTVTTRKKILLFALLSSLFALNIQLGFAQTVAFNPATNFSVGTGPVLVAIGDFNRDGKLDLAVANSVDNNISILLGSWRRDLWGGDEFCRRNRSGVGGGGGFQREWEARFGGGEFWQQQCFDSFGQ